ncbi:hypothetical protein AVEN_149875-1 [Araneus ventricosus]|uniref:Uncharacterized protein n=1 Tax=Araneus ventricosus TaxID=182803 RepID=A0A4Y2DWL6_ARAVE|nr:hypothetical protein AVEN_149875-1 [Araneus ventricosus]
MNRIGSNDVLAKSIFSSQSLTGRMVSVSASELVDREFYPELCSYSVFAIICVQCKLVASLSHGDSEACVNLLQTCFTLALLSCQTCCKLADLQCKFAAN